LNFSQQPAGQLLLSDVDADSKTLQADSAIYWQQLHTPAQAGSFLLVGNDNQLWSVSQYYNNNNNNSSNNSTCTSMHLDIRIRANIWFKCNSTA
jgi:hypothetical protein